MVMCLCFEVCTGPCETTEAFSSRNGQSQEQSLGDSRSAVFGPLAWSPNPAGKQALQSSKQVWQPQKLRTHNRALLRVLKRVTTQAGRLESFVKLRLTHAGRVDHQAVLERRPHRSQQISEHGRKCKQSLGCCRSTACCKLPA